jgi:hypothetical protein
VDNEFIGNRCGDHGAGAYVLNSGSGLNVNIARNVFFENQGAGAHRADSFLELHARSAGWVDNGSGGGLWVSGVQGVVENNTLARNIGQGESSCSGGGILVEQSSPGLIIRRNIIAFNEGRGISCNMSPTSSVYDNILWENTQGEVCEGKCPVWDYISANPLFCNLDEGDLSVATTSPALSGGEVIGAIVTPGCPGTAVERMTWGWVKARY